MPLEWNTWKRKIIQEILETKIIYIIEMVSKKLNQNILHVSSVLLVLFTVKKFS